MALERICDRCKARFPDDGQSCRTFQLTADTDHGRPLNAKWLGDLCAPCLAEIVFCLKTPPARTLPAQQGG